MAEPEKASGGDAPKTFVTLASKPGTTFRKPGNYPPGHPLYQKPGGTEAPAPAPVAAPPAPPVLKIYSPEEKMQIWARLRKLAETHQKELLTDLFNQHNVPRDGPGAGALNIEMDEDEKAAEEIASAADKLDEEEVKIEKKEDFFAVAPSLGGIRHRSTAQAAFLTRARNRQTVLTAFEDDVDNNNLAKPLKPLHVKTLGAMEKQASDSKSASETKLAEEKQAETVVEQASDLSNQAAIEDDVDDLPAPPEEAEDELPPEVEEEPPLPEIPYYTSGESELEDDGSEDDEEEEYGIDVNDLRSAVKLGSSGVVNELRSNIYEKNPLNLRSFPEKEKKTSSFLEKKPALASRENSNAGVSHLATSTEIREKGEKAGAGRRVAPQLESLKSVPSEQIDALIKSYENIRHVSTEPPPRLRHQRSVNLIETQHANETRDMKNMAAQELAALETSTSSDSLGGDELGNTDDKQQMFVRVFFQPRTSRVASCLVRVDEGVRFEDLLPKVHAKVAQASNLRLSSPEQAAKLAQIKEIEKELDTVSYLRQEIKAQSPSASQKKKLKETHLKLEALGITLTNLKEDIAIERESNSSSSLEMLGLYARSVKSNKGQWLSASTNPFQVLEQLNKGEDRAVLVYAKHKVTLTISINQDVGVSAEAVVKFESFTFDSSFTSEEAVAAVAKFMGVLPQNANLLNLQIPFPDGRWLDDEVPLYESVGFHPQTSVNLSLRSRFFLERIDCISSDPTVFQFIFSQAVQCVTSGNYNCSQARATLFGALLIVVLSGSFYAFSKQGENDKQSLRRYQVLLHSVLPSHYLTSNQSIRVMAKDVRKAHEQLGELGTTAAMLAYLNLMKNGWMDTVRVVPTTKQQKQQKNEKLKPKKPGCYEFFCTGKTRNNTNHNLSAEIDVNDRTLVLKKVGSGLKQWSCNLPIKSIIGVEVPNKDSKLIRLFSFSMGSTDLSFASTQERLVFSSCLQLAISKTAEIMNKPQGEMMMQMMTDPAIYQSLAFAQVNFENHLAMHKRVSPPDTAKLSVFIGTYNCGSNGPDNMTWMEKGHDVYVWGVQECNYKPRKPHSTCETDWVACMQNHLGSDFMLVKNLSMWEIRLIVMAKDVLMPFITNVEAGYEATGLGNVVKNKGGVAIGLTIFDTSMAFFNCHLAARPNKGRMKLRNKNMQTILHSMANKLGFVHYDTLNSFDLVYILGDLNYRVVGKSREFILEAIEKKKYYALLQNDQLNQQKASGNIAFTFQEAPITWQPSYRYQTDNNQWSTKKLFNLPSYCDRVLWQARPTVTVNPVSYQQAMDVFGSDHRPIAAVHEVTVRRAIPKEPSELRFCVVRVYGLTVDLFLKEKYLATKRHVLKRLSITSQYLREALDVHGECVDDDESDFKEDDNGSLGSALPIPKGFKHTSRFSADEIITFSLAEMAPRDVDGASLVLTMFVQGSGEPAGHAVVSLKDSCEVSGRTSPVPVSGYFTLDGLPQASFFASVVTCYDNSPK